MEQPTTTTLPPPIAFVADLGGHVFAEIIRTSETHHQLLIIDPARLANPTGADRGSPNPGAVVGSWDAGNVILSASLDGQTLLGWGATADGASGTIVRVDVTNPLAPAIASMVSSPTGFGAPQPLGDGNVLNSWVSPPQSQSQLVVMDPATGVIRSATDHLSCRGWLPLGIDRLFCLAPNNSTSVRVYAYSSVGGLGDNVTAAYVPGGRDYFLPFAEPSGRLHWFDGAVDGPLLVSAEVDPAGNVKVLSAVALPTLDGLPLSITGILPFDGVGRRVLAVTALGKPTENSAIVVDDYRSGSDVLAPPVVVLERDYIEQMTLVPALGPTAYAVATGHSGVQFFRLDDSGLPEFLGAVVPNAVP